MAVEQEVGAVAWMYTHPALRHPRVYTEQQSSDFADMGYTETPLYANPAPSVSDKPLMRDTAVEEVQRSFDNACAQLAAEAVRSAFLVSVSGDEKPYRYHLRLAYPSMDAMHEAEDALKALASHPTFQPLATRLATPTPVEEPAKGAVGITADELGEIMQEEWGEICEDAQAHPLDIRREGRKLFYDPRHWTDAIARRLSERATAPSPSNAVASVSDEQVEDALPNCISALCSLRKNYEEDLPLWADVSRFITEGNAALQAQPNGGAKVDVVAIAESFIIADERDERDNARNATAGLIAGAIRAALNGTKP